MDEELKANRYKVEKEIGRGGMGVVLRARDTRLGRAVALKMLPREVTHDSDLRRRLAVEARAASAFSHPDVATVFDYLEQAEESFIVYEFVEGSTLRACLGRGRFTAAEILEVGIQLADALAAAHEHAVVHRDLKPENIMVAPGPQSPGRVKILDFGLAKRRPMLTRLDGQETALETEPVATAPGLLVGTVNYMAPEQLSGEPADSRTDLYALGLVLYEMATGANPFVGKSPTSTIANILTQEPPSMAARAPLAPPELDRIIHKCLRKRREERYQSAREIWVDLSNLRHDTGEARRPAGVESGKGEPSLLGRALGFIARTPRRWWELNHLLALVAYPFLAYVGWLIRPWITVPGWSLAAFLGLVLAVAVTVTLRMYLLVTAAFTPQRLGEEVRRVGVDLRGVTASFWGILVVMAALGISAHPGSAAVLIGLAVGGAMVSLVVEPAIDRAAFPQLSLAREPEALFPGAAVAGQASEPAVAVLPVSRGVIRALLLLIQAGYLVMYSFFWVHLNDALAPQGPTGEWIGFGALLAATGGMPVRLYLLSAVGFDYLDLGRKFRWLFLPLAFLDWCWAAVPLLLVSKFGWLIILFSAGLAYLPFAQRTLVFSAYSPRGGRTSGVQAPKSL